jgi:hypothetical protein
MLSQRIGREVCAVVKCIYPLISSATLVLTVIAQVVCSSPANACSICESGDPLAPAGIAKLEAGQSQIALNYEFLTARARSNENPLFIEELTQMTLRAMFAFSPWEPLSAVMQVPVVYKNFSETSEGYSPTRTRPTGLGDVDLGVRVFLLSHKDFARNSWHRFGVSLGSTLPTGRNDAQTNGLRIDDHAQLGTGAFTPYAGLIYSFSQDRWNFFGTVHAKRPFDNGYAYRYGSALLWSFAVEYRAIDRLSLGLGFDGRYALRDIRDGEIMSNTGGFVAAAAPMVKFNVYDALWLTARAQLPFATHLFGEQSVGPTLMIGVQYTID